MPTRKCMKADEMRSLAGFIDMIVGTFVVAFQVVTSVYSIPFETGSALIVVNGAFTISFFVKWTSYRDYSSGNELFSRSGNKLHWKSFYTNPKFKPQKFKPLIFLEEFKFAPWITLPLSILLVALNSLTIVYPDEPIWTFVTIPFTAFATSFEPWLYDFLGLERWKKEVPKTAKEEEKKEEENEETKEEKDEKDVNLQI